MSSSVIPASVCHSWQSFVTTAEEQRWILVSAYGSAPRELLRVIADYFCTSGHVWDVLIATNTTGNFQNFTFAPRPKNGGSGAVTTAFVAGEYAWRRLWGAYSFGSGQASPYFAVRISNVHKPKLPSPQNSSVYDGSVLALNVGVSSWKTPSTDPVYYYGVERDDFAVMSSRRAVFDSRYHKNKYGKVDSNTNTTEPHGIVAVANGKVISRVLSTTATAATQPTSPENWIGSAGEGFALIDHNKPIVVGIACDLTTNTMRVFVDDRVLRVTPDSYSANNASDQVVDAALAVGDPFVWHIPNLGDCYPLISAFHCAATIELVDDWIPPSR